MLKENLPVMASSEYDKGNLCFADGTHRDATSHYILAIKNYLQYAYRKLDDKNKLPVTFGGAVEQSWRWIPCEDFKGDDF